MQADFIYVRIYRDVSIYVVYLHIYYAMIEYKEISTDIIPSFFKYCHQLDQK
jgi:hypothetical protein